jgi:hypothetical protein
MANQNIRTPRFYTDIINHLLASGSAQDGNFDVVATAGGAEGTIGIQNGSEAELFDMRPLNKVDFDTSSTVAGHVLINLNLSTFKKSFIAILNHNLATAVGKIRIFAGDEATDVSAKDGANADTGDISWNDVAVAEVVNADAITTAGSNRSKVIEPTTDGSTIITFPEKDLRYWGIQFEGNTTNTGNADNGTWGSTDLFVGCILIGEYYDMPHAPDLAVKRSISFDGMNSVQESVGGQRFSNATNFGRTGTTTSKSPFNNALYQNKVYSGRITYDMNFSYLNSTDLMPNEYDDSNLSDDAVVEDVWHKTRGSHIPFIFSVDKDSDGDNAESEHIFARFAQNSLDMTQVANDVFNISMRIEEEF